MVGNVAPDLKHFIGRELERLSLAEQHAMAGKWIALEIYSPQTLPLRHIEAIGDSVTGCMAQLEERELDPRGFEFLLLSPPQ